MIKKFLLVFMLLTLTGCGKKAENFVVNSAIGDKIYSYQSSLDIYGFYNDDNIEFNEEIINYKNEDYQIEQNDEMFYIIDDYYYKMVDGKKSDYDETIKFIDSDYILNTIKKTKQIKEYEETVDSIKYKTLIYKTAKKEMEKILKNSTLNNIKLKEDVDTKVYINEDNEVYLIEYYLNKAIEQEKVLTMSVYYKNVNKYDRIIIEEKKEKRHE